MNSPFRDFFLRIIVPQMQKIWYTILEKIGTGRIRHGDAHPLYVVSSPLRGGPHADTHGLCGGGGMVKIARAASISGRSPASPAAQRQRHGVLFRLPAAMLLLPESRHQRRKFRAGDIHPAPGGYFSELQEQGAHSINQILVTAGITCPGYARHSIWPGPGCISRWYTIPAAMKRPRPWPPCAAMWTSGWRTSNTARRSFPLNIQTRRTISRLPAPP